MKKPNLFILGAPKCGTTSLAQWLSEHPLIFMSPIKEPSFFDEDVKSSINYSLDEYEELFSKSKRDHFILQKPAPIIYTRDGRCQTFWNM